jgi:polyisoprenyl-phosphate glycosyltransferase
MTASEANEIVLLIPVYNDWESIGALLPALDTALHDYPVPIHVLLVDDGSTTPPSGSEFEELFHNLVRIEILRLRCNLGHQRAIAVGLYHIHANIPCRGVLVMDGDGEDRPEDVPKLLAEFDRRSGSKTIFAARTKRMESVAFQLFYHLYRLTHRVLTGVTVRVGNFSVVPRDAVDALMVDSNLWNHYAATVFRSRLPYDLIRLPRGKRLHGRSKMNFFALLVHGLSAISVFGDLVSVRLLAGAGVSLLAASGAFLIHGGSLAVWGMLILSAQALTSAILLVFRTVGSRSSTSFLPVRDAHYFVQEARTVFAANERIQLHRLRVGHL